MEVGDRFPAVRAIIDDDAVSGVGETDQAGRRGGGRKKDAEKLRVTGSRGIEPRNADFRHHEDMDRGLRSNVSEGDPILTFGHDIGRYLPGCDLFEERHACRECFS